MATYSYTRVSTTGKGQTTDNQDKLIADAGFAIDKVFADVGVSGSIPAFERPAFKEMLSVLKESDQVVCIMIDRLGRTASDVLQTVEYFKAHKIKLRVLQLDMIDLTSSMGKLVLTMLAAVAEMERNLISERTVAGLSRTKAQGTCLGAKFKLPPESLQQAHKWMSEKVKHEDIAHRLNIGVATLYNLKREFMGSNEKMQEYKQRYDAQQLQIKSNNA